MILNKYNISFVALLVFHFLVLLFINDNFSISYKEAYIYFETNNLLSFLTNFSTSLFGQNDLALRLPFIIFYLASAIILYLLTDDYFKRDIDRLITLSIFMILPGVNSAALLVNESIIVVFGTLLYLYLYKLREKEHYFILFIFLFVDNSFAILFLALFLYSLKKKDNTLLTVSLTLFGLSMSMYGFDVGGHPRGYFIDTFAIYATIFSPLLFLYFFYSLYRVGIKFEKDMYWYISFTALILSFVFSLRQKIAIEDFAPFVVIAIPIMVKLFMHSVRVRLKSFRTFHYNMAIVILSILFLNFILFAFNKYLYLIIEEPSDHFAYKHHVVKELSMKLKKSNINQVITDDHKLSLRLKFYGITHGDKYFITSSNFDVVDKEIDIKYHHRLVARFTVVDLKQ